MLNFDGVGHEDGHSDVMCKQTFRQQTRIDDKLNTVKGAER